MLVEAPKLSLVELLRHVSVFALCIAPYAVCEDFAPGGWSGRHWSDVVALVDPVISDSTGYIV